MAIAPSLVLLGTAPAANAEETFPVNPTATYLLPATTAEGVATNPLTSWDISFVDNTSGMFLLADRSNASIDVMDLNSNAIIVASPLNNGSCTQPNTNFPACKFQGLVTDPNAGAINDISGPNGVILVNHREIWAGDAPTLTGAIIGPDAVCQGGNLAECANDYLPVDNCDSSVKVLDLRTQLVTDVINTGGCFRADELAVDPIDQVVIVANDAEQDIANADFVTLISTKKGHAILAQIPFDGTAGTPFATGGIEQPQWNPNDGNFYIAVPAAGGTFANPSTTGAVVVISPKTFAVVSSFPIANCTPNGIAIGPKNQAILGCNAHAPLQVINLSNGSVAATIPQVMGGCDEVWYEAGENHYLAACSQASVANPFYVVGVIDASYVSRPPLWDANITTKPTALGGGMHSLAADDFTSRILVPIGKGDPLCGAATATGCIAAWQAPQGDADDPNLASVAKERMFEQ
jgi:DNA-binding beta-propeller fold protein YncE